MSAVLTRRRRSGRGRERDHRQPSLFSQVVAPPRPEDTRAAAGVQAPPRPEDARAGEVAMPVRELDAPVTAPAGPQIDAPQTGAAALASPTLDDAISALWGELTTGAAVDCPVCGSEMTPRHSAGSGVVGGRCGTCATTLA